jgi:citrate synthase
MDTLKQRFKEKADALNTEIKGIMAAHSAMPLDTVDIGQAFGGMRDITSMIWETSLLDANEGIRFRGYSIPQLQELLPKAPDCNEPLPEALFHLMLIGEIPTQEETNWLTAEWRRRSHIPEHIFTIIEALPMDMHPMAQFVTAVSSLQSTSTFAARYAQGMSKADYWDACYEDTMNVIARLPRIAAYIFRRTYHKGVHIAPDNSLDWAGNFAHMLGVSDRADFKSLMRLYMTIHADHEGGNASAHTSHLVGSTLADPYLSLTGALTALAGPLHGLANQEVIRWIFKMCDSLGSKKPTNAQIEQYVQDTLNAKRVVPGYGHAVLRVPDPRFMAQKEFAEKHCADDDTVQTVWNVFESVPPILKTIGKIKNPWPNVDAHSGALLVHYGMTEYNFYTVMFGVSRALGVLAALCWSRALGFPLERPKSVTTEWIKEFIAAQQP